ncbi:MAG: pseudouridine synthase [Eubacteriales bacterium]|nr:pseudouridine synthase [Eubacteriales bacterium]
MPIIETYTAEFAPQYPVPILYEDNHLLFALKAPGLLSQEDKTGKADILRILKAYLVEKYHKPGKAWLGLVHRLDQTVGGVMVFAKTSKAASRLSELIRRQQMTKTYRAIVRGRVEPQAGHWQDRISQAMRGGRYVVDSGGRPCSLNYQRLSYQELPQVGGLSLLEIELLTGRSHQIRVQTSSRHWPLAGDRRYGLGDEFDHSLAWPSLFATSLAFIHPVSRETIKVEAPLPRTTPWTYFTSALLSGEDKANRLV